METKISTTIEDNFKRKMGFNNCLNVSSCGNSGGLALLWQNQFDISVSSFSIIIKDLNWWWRFTGFYGNPDQGKRKESWKLLERLHESINLPWIIGGDFNEIMFNKEKKGGPPKPYSLLNDFCDAIRNCELIDIGFSCDRYTWSRNRQVKDSIKERLDRFFVNAKIDQMAKTMKVDHLNFFHSDHWPILLDIGWENANHQNKFTKKKEYGLRKSGPTWKVVSTPSKRLGMTQPSLLMPISARRFKTALMLCRFGTKSA